MQNDAKNKLQTWQQKGEQLREKQDVEMMRETNRPQLRSAHSVDDWLLRNLWRCVMLKDKEEDV